MLLLLSRHIIFNQLVYIYHAPKNYIQVIRQTATCFQAFIEFGIIIFIVLVIKPVNLVAVEKFGKVFRAKFSISKKLVYFAPKFSIMTKEEISKIIAQGEGVSVEFKEAREKVPHSVYETVVSFANTRGGYILLGVADNGSVLGIHPEKIASFLKNIATALNSKDNINPVMYLNPSSIECEGKTIIVIQVPAS